MTENLNAITLFRHYPMCAYITRCMGPQMYAPLLYFCALVKIKVLCLQWYLGEISTKTVRKGSCGESLPRGGTDGVLPKWLRHEEGIRSRG